MSGTIHERIKEMVNFFGGGANTAFANIVGVSEGNIRGYIKNVVPKQDFLEKVVRNCDVNPTWLLTGKGEMIINTQEAPIARHIESPNEGIPLIPLSAMAGAFTGEQNVLEYECERYIIPAFNGADFLIPVKGNSMNPTYVSGDIVACQRVPMSGLFFQWNKPYVLDTKQGALIKRIKPGHNGDHVLIVSDNEQYDPFELPYSEIYAVALVIGIIRLE